MTKEELIEIIEGCVYNSQVLTEERVCFDELRKELNEELPEQLTLTDVVKPSLCELYDFGRQNKACEKKCNSCKWMEGQ